MFADFYRIIQICPEITHFFLLYITIFVTLSRLSAVKNPPGIREKILFFRNYSRIFIFEIILFLIAVILNIPMILEEDLVSIEQFHNETDFQVLMNLSSKIHVIRKKIFSESCLYRIYNFVDVVLQQIFHISIIIAINFKLILYIRHNIRRRTFNVSLKILSIYIVIFLISEIPDTLTHLSQVIFKLFPNFSIVFISFLRSNYIFSRMFLEINVDNARNFVMHSRIYLNFT